jgi:hypothetical protein
LKAAEIEAAIYLCRVLLKTLEIVASSGKEIIPEHANAKNDALHSTGFLAEEVSKRLEQLQAEFARSETKAAVGKAEG